MSNIGVAVYQHLIRPNNFINGGSDLVIVKKGISLNVCEIHLELLSSRTDGLMGPRKTF